MRKHLLETFDEIYIVNLHGNTRKGETDKNIFDVMVGVTIVLLVKLPKRTNKKVVKYFSTLDNKIITRPEKLDFLQEIRFKKINWKTLEPTEPNYWFIEKDFSLQKKYNKFWNVTNIFEVFGAGPKSQRDIMATHYNEKNLDKVLLDLLNLSEQDIAMKYQVEDSRDWKVSFAKKDVYLNYKNKDKFIKKILYRPFDIRYTFYTATSKGLFAVPQRKYNNEISNDNLGLIFPRGIAGSFTHCSISNCIVDCSCGGAHSAKETFVAPLYLYQDDGEVFKKTERVANFTADFSKFLKTLNFRPSPEKILAYIYAILHSPIYRKKYIEFLKIDFPAVPFTTDKSIFEKYAKLGQRLIDLHLLKEKLNDNSIKVNGAVGESFTIDKIVYENETLYLHTTDNKRITIEGITQAIYDFEIGSYKPIDKWLKYRKNDKVLLDNKDLQHIKDMAIAIDHTIEIMCEIEELGEEYLSGV
jgi:predicted helicase